MQLKAMRQSKVSIKKPAAIGPRQEAIPVAAADSPESESAVIALIQTGDQPEDRRDKETGADTDQQTAAPGEHKNVAGESYDKFADGAHRSADAESFFPADDQADHTADDHQAAGAQRINNVGQLDV